MNEAFLNHRDPNESPDLSAVKPALEKFRAEIQLEGLSEAEINETNFQDVVTRVRDFWQEQLRRHDGTIELGEYMENKLNNAEAILDALADPDPNVIDRADNRTIVAELLEDIGVEI